LIQTPQTTEDQKPILSDSAGRIYLNGLTSIDVVEPGGEIWSWPIPELIQGAGVIDGRALMVEVDPVTVLLLNSSGRVARLKRLQDQSFELETVFTRGVPTEPLVRAWVDPAGRLVMTTSRQLSIAFPQGQIPGAIVKLMTGESFRRATSGQLPRAIHLSN